MPRDSFSEWVKNSKVAIINGLNNFDNLFDKLKTAGVFLLVFIFVHTLLLLLGFNFLEIIFNPNPIWNFVLPTLYLSLWFNSYRIFFSKIDDNALLTILIVVVVLSAISALWKFIELFRKQQNNEVSYG